MSDESDEDICGLCGLTADLPLVALEAIHPSPAEGSTRKGRFPMSERIASEIWIGGKVSERLVPDLCKAIASQVVLLDWGDARFSPASAEDLIQACRDNSDGVRLLWLCADEARWGEFEELEGFLRKHEIPFTRKSTGRYEYNPERVEYRPGRAALCHETNSAGEPVLVASELVPVADLLAAALELSENHSTVDSWSLVKTATRLLQEQLPPALPSLEPFEIEPVENRDKEKEDKTDGQ